MRAFVTGGGGFLGKAVIKQLLGRGYEVISYSRSDYPELKTMGVKHVLGDMNESDKLIEAMRGSDVVFHIAAKAGIWGKYDDFYNANVVGTENIIDACQKLGIKKLVYTSTPSVIYRNSGIEGENEKSLPYPEHFEGFYPQTKAIAEKLVLEANNENLSTVALRPHLIWGPGDHHFLPRLIDRSKAGKLRILGNDKNLVDSVYIDNAATAHLQALDKLTPNSNVAGKAYFITQDQPIPIADLINKILVAANAPIVTKKISPKIAYFAGFVLEKIYTIFNLKGEPPMTRFLAKQLSTPHWFDISAAKNDFGYREEVSIDQGMINLSEWIKETHPHPI